MATNPMQRKARNSFLLGVVITLILATAVIAILLIQLKNYKEKEAEEIANKKKVWVLSQDVISGQIITTDMLKQLEINKNFVPSNAIGNMSIITNYMLTDKEGNDVITEYKNNESTLYLVKNGSKFQLKQESETGNYYIETSGEKEYVELAESPLIAKIDMNKNTVITVDLISKSDEKTTNDLRIQEYNMLELPTQLETGEYIDIRLSLPSGLDYIVISKKQVDIPEINGSLSADTILLNLKEEEIITMNNAIVDAYRILGARLYVNIYKEAGIQDAATPTYVPTRETLELIRANPNVIQEAKNTLTIRYNENNEKVRNESINSAINNNGQEGEENLKTKIQESITNKKQNRQQYLQSLQ